MERRVIVVIRAAAEAKVEAFSHLVMALFAHVVAAPDLDNYVRG